MGRESKYPYEEKLQAVKECITGKVSIKKKSQQMGVSNWSMQTWVSQYHSMGEAGLRSEQKNKKYPAEVKEAAVKEYLSGKGSKLGICQKYKIRSKTQLTYWIKQYTGHEQFKTKGTGGTVVTKGRKPTFDERVEIVKACIEKQHNYNAVAEIYSVSYQQVRNWTVKYEQSGVEALADRRGRRKPEREMTELENLKAQNKLLEARNRRLLLENDFLKKLKELEGGGA